MIGSVLEEALRAAGVKHVACLVTRTVVAADDVAFKTPTKPIGPLLGTVAPSGHASARDAATGQYRKVVASPLPVTVDERPGNGVVVRD